MEKNPFKEIKNAYDYALRNNINPKDKRTWDGEYKNRMQQLAGIIPLVEQELKGIKNINKKK